MSSAAPAASPRRHRARRGEGGRLREEILAAGTRLLLETGDDEAVSIRAIAQAVGVTPPSIYLHFADKTELIYAICEELFRKLDDEMAAAAAGVDGPAATAWRTPRPTGCCSCTTRTRSPTPSTPRT